jgi:glycerophosphoryl diester phosphodiesterase
MGRPHTRGESWFRKEGARPLVLGHRGARFGAPENTLAAFELARTQAADGVELDVRLTGDREVIVFHDPTLSRATSGTDRRSLERVTAAELAQVRFHGEPIPLLTEVLDWARATGQRLNIELKHDGFETPTLVRKVVALLEAEPDVPERILLSCFHPGVVRALARALPDVVVSWLVHDEQRVFRFAPGFRQLGASGVNPERTLLQPWRVRLWKLQGALLGTWTVNSAVEAVRAAELGVDVIISDLPGHVLAALRAAPARA